MPGNASLAMIARAALVALVMVASPLPSAMAQTPDTPSSDASADKPAAAPDAGGGVYKPPLRGAPGGRVGGASRGAIKMIGALRCRRSELVAPLDHTGETASAAPTLYFFVSQPVALPTQLTISAPLRAAPILEATFPSPPARGLYALRLADYHVQLEPGIVYTWSVSAIVDTRSWSRNVVASATILRVASDPAVDAAARAAPPLQRTMLLGRTGLWYDAVAAAAEAQNLDRHATLDKLLTEVGLTEPASVDRAADALPAR